MNPNFDRILIGDNPFIGVDHLSQERVRGRGSRLDSRGIANIIRIALASGAEGVVCSSRPEMRAALGAMRDHSSPTPFGVHLIVPDAQSYVRTASEAGILGLLNETLMKMTVMGGVKAIMGGTLATFTSNPERLMRTILEAEVSLFSKALPESAQTKSVFLHELLTDLMTSFKMKDMMEEYVGFAKDIMGVTPGFETRNFARFVEFVLSTSIPTNEICIMTPFNSVGFQMNPSRRKCEEALGLVPDTPIIGMSVLASGFLGLEKAVDYLNRLPRRISCVIGVSQETHARETFSYLKSNLH